MRSVYLLLFILLISCGGVDVPDPQVGEPVFVGAFELEGTSKVWKAGVNGVHSQPGYSLLGQSLVLTSLLKEESCERNCPESFELRLGSWVPYNTEFSMEKAVKMGDYAFFLDGKTGPDSLEIIVHDDSRMSRDIKDRWTHNNEAVTPGYSPDSLRFLVPVGGLNTLCLHRIDKHDNEVSHCQTFGSDQGREVPKAKILVSHDQRMVFLEAKPVGKFDVKEVEYQWDYQGGQKKWKIQLPIQDAMDRRFCFSAKKGDLLSRSCVYFKMDPGTLEDDAIFSIVREGVVHTGPSDIMGKIEINYIDESGIRYSTSLRHASENQFAIEDIASFLDPVRNEEFLKITTTFEAVLYNSRGQRLRLTNGRAVWPLVILK